MKKSTPPSLSPRSWEQKDAEADRKKGIKEGSKKDLKLDKATGEPNASAKYQDASTTAKVQNFFQSKDVAKKKGKGY